MHLPNGICVKTLPLAGERQGDTADLRRAHDSRVWVKGYRLKVKGKVNTTNRPFVGAVGVEEIKGLVQNAKWARVRNTKWAVYK